jgi:hypothetical protein
MEKFAGDLRLEGRGFVKNAKRIVVTLTASQFPGA